MSHLEIADLHAKYGDLTVLDGVDLTLDRAQIAGLIGPSGSGKSTLLRVLVGLLEPAGGEIRLDGQSVNYKRKAEVRALRDRFAVVFQQYNLFQNMTALRNVTIAPIKVKGRPAREVEAEAKELLDKVGLGEKFDAYPDQLSGGQQQRVAIARAMALKPEILLLDEVTSALDPELVSEVLETIRVLAHEGMTMLIVSHEMGFIREVASKVAFFDAGKTVEVGQPKEIFDNPQTTRCQDFVSKILHH